MVSVIVPNYNHAQFLQQRLESVYNQTYADFEVILLDDQSTDNSVGVLNEYRHHEKTSMLIVNEKNSGSPFAQWRKGLQLAKGELIWIAESDDVAQVTFLEKLISRMDPHTVLAYCGSQKIDSENQILPNKWLNSIDADRWDNDYTVGGHKEILEYLYYFNTIQNASACVFRRPSDELLADLTTMKFCGDWIFWIRLLQEDGGVAYSAERLNSFRSHVGTSRAKGQRPQEVRRLEEYLSCMRHAYNALGSPPDPKRYRWILNQMWVNQMYSRLFNILDVPVPLSLPQYCRLLLQEMSRKVLAK